MSAIPEDIMKVAEEVVDRIATVNVWRGDCVLDVATAVLAERRKCAEALSEAKQREKDARSPFEIVADWHDKQALTFKDMAHDTRSGQLGMLKAAEAAKHHAGSAAALRLHAINARRAALERSEG